MREVAGGGEDGVGSRAGDVEGPVYGGAGEGFEGARGGDSDGGGAGGNARGCGRVPETLCHGRPGSRRSSGSRNELSLVAAGCHGATADADAAGFGGGEWYEVGETFGRAVGGTGKVRWYVGERGGGTVLQRLF